jgi:hypothetical protein
VAPPPPPPPPAHEGGHGHEGGREGDHGHGKGHHEEPTFHLSLDAVAGFGKLDIAAQPAATSGNQFPAYGVSQAKVFSTSLLFGAAFEVAHGVEIGVRWPFSYASLSPEGSNERRGTSAAGNLELEGAYETHLMHDLALAADLAFALPTAQGFPLPEKIGEQNPQLVQQNDFDRGAVNRAARASRGWEDNALFSPHYFGIIPQVKLAYKVDKLHIDPWVKVENMIRTNSAEENKFIGELVIGTRVAYRVARELDVGFRVWGNIGFAGTEKDAAGNESKPSAGVVEPQIRGHFGPVQPTVGVLIPFAGHGLTDPRWTGVRIGVAAAFLELDA